MSFTRMEQGKIEDWMVIGLAVTQRQSSMPSIIKAMLLQLEGQVDGFAVNQLHHLGSSVFFRCLPRTL